MQDDDALWHIPKGDQPAPELTRDQIAQRAYELMMTRAHSKNETRWLGWDDIGDYFRRQWRMNVDAVLDVAGGDE